MATTPTSGAADLLAMVSKALREAYNLGQRYWQQADSEYISQHKKADDTRAKFLALVEETCAALAAGQATAPQQEVPDECFPGEPKVAVPQGLIGAACFAIRNNRNGSKVLEQLRRYSVGDQSQPLAPQPVARVPLTPERVKEIVRGAGYNQCGIPDTERAAFINGLRHGEQAHGIKGGQHGTE